MTLTVLMNAGPWLSVPPPGYGGIENVIATLVPELRRLGVRVVLASVAYFSFRGDASLHELLVTAFLSLTAPISAHMLAKAALQRQLPVDPRTRGSGWMPRIRD